MCFFFHMTSQFFSNKTLDCCKGLHLTTMSEQIKASIFPYILGVELIYEDFPTVITTYDDKIWALEFYLQTGSFILAPSNKGGLSPTNNPNWNGFKVPPRFHLTSKLINYYYCCKRSLDGLFFSISAMPTELTCQIFIKKHYKTVNTSHCVIN